MEVGELSAILESCENVDLNAVAVRPIIEDGPLKHERTGNPANLKGHLRLIENLLAAKRCQDADDVFRSDALRGLPRTASLLLQAKLELAKDNFARAAEAFEQVLQEESDHLEALKQFAQLRHQCGDLEGALSYLKRAASVAPEDADVAQAQAQALVALGAAASGNGDLEGALQLFTEALAACDEHADALFHIGVLALQQNHLHDSRQLYTRAVRACPAHVQAWTNLGVLHRQQGRFSEALHCFQQALQHAPNNPIVRTNMAMLYVDLGARVDKRQAAATSCEAEDPADGDADESSAGAACWALGSESRPYYERALAYESNNADALYNLGVLESASQQWERAMFYYETCLRSNPTHCMAWNNLGVVCQNVDNLERGMECYQRAIELRPDFCESLNNLGVICTTQGLFGTAQALLRRAIAANPSYAEAHNNLGVLFRDVGLVQEAIEMYSKCMQLCPESPNAFQNRLLALNYCTAGEDEAVAQAHAEWGEAFQAQVTPLPPICRESWRRPGDSPLRVGYISPDLYTHSVSYFAQALLHHHDPSRVEVFVYCCTPRPDAKSELLKSGFEGKGLGTWRCVLGMSDEEAAALIREDAVDVLVELTGHTANNRLGIMRYRAAPVQMTYLGYPNSTGLRAVDYRITDAVSDPLDTTQPYVEQLLRLDGCFLCYCPMLPHPRVALPPCLANGYITFGSFNALAKITDEVVQVWSQLLHAVPNSRLVLKNKPFACERARALWLRRFAAHGVAKWRLDLLPLTAGTAAHLEQYALMDISLDPWPYAGTTTTCESLFMGVPCISLRGRCHAHNVGVSLLTALDMEKDWVAQDIQEYLAIGVKASSEPSELESLRGQLRQKMLASPLCDAPKFVQGLEDRFYACFQEWSKGAVTDTAL